MARNIVRYSNLDDRFVRDIWTPSDISTAAWYDASDDITVDNLGGDVTQWSDKSGNARHLSQGTEAFRPTTDSITINGLNVIDFNGSTDYLSVANASWHNNGDLHIFSVARCDGSTDAIIANDDASGGWFGRVNTDNEYRSSMNGDGVTATAGTFTPATTHIFESRFATPTVGSRIDGGTEVTNSGTGYTSTANPLTIGAATGGTANYFDGEIAEIIIVSGVVSEINRQKIEGYLAWKWGLYANLPSTHPWKTAPPVNGG